MDPLHRRQQTPRRPPRRRKIEHPEERTLFAPHFVQRWLQDV
jgi:hypothetical protein